MQPPTEPTAHDAGRAARRRGRALPPPPPRPPPRRRPRRQRPARAHRGRLPERLGDPAPSPARPRRRSSAGSTSSRSARPSGSASASAAHVHLEDRARRPDRGTPSSPTRSRSTTSSRRARRCALLAALPDRQRDDLTLLVAGFSYDEIAELTGGRTYTNVNKHIAKARARVAACAGSATAPDGGQEVAARGSL